MENTNLKGRRPELVIYFVLSLGGKMPGFGVVLWIVHKVGEIRADPSDLTVHQSRAVLDATLQLRGTAVGVAILHPPGSRLAQVPAVAVSQAGLFHSMVGPWSTTCLVKPHIQQGGTLGRWGLQSKGAPARGMGGQVGTPLLDSHRGVMTGTELKV